MFDTTAGSGIALADIYVPTPDPVVEEVIPPASLMEALRAEMRKEFADAVADVERRLAQAREIEQANATGVPRSTVHAEDLNINRHLLDGYLLTSNSPSAGSIAWSSLHVVYLGVDYTIADGNTANKYAWFVKPGSGTTATLNTGNAVPALGANDKLIFVNNGGVGIPAADSSISYAIADNAVTNAALASGSVTSDKTNFYTALTTAIQGASDAATLAQATADGAIVTYFQSNPPWATGDATAGGATNPATKTGDVWYDSDDGQAYRWSGPAGSPANTWVAINDSDMAAALTAANNAQSTANSRITTFYAAAAAVPTALAVGDLWIVTDQNNQIRRASAVGTASWVATQFGDNAISGVGGSKVGSGINASNVTTGTLSGGLVGTGVNATNVTTGTLSGALVGTGVNGGNINTGTVGSTQLGANAVTPVKINAAFHILY